MPRQTILWLAFGLAILATGCRGRSDLVEAELRYRDRQVRELQSELGRTCAVNDAYETTLREQRGQCASVPQGGSLCVVKEIQVGRGTGGIDEDKCAGDEGVLVVIVPKDVDGSAVKANGVARVTAMQITPEGLKVPLSTWDITAVHLRRNWKSGLLSTGYYVSLPWQVVPSFEKLRMIVTFTTADGAVYEAERDVQVRLGADAPKPGGQLLTPLPGAPSNLEFPTPVPGPLPPPTPIFPGGVVPSGPNISQKVPVTLWPPNSHP